jgi:hypothetical protein
MSPRKMLGAAPAVAVLLIAGITGGAGVLTAYAAPKDLSADQKVQVRKGDERRQKKLDKEYAKQAKAQAKYYAKRAKEVQNVGGNAQPLLEAAAHFDSEAKKYQ